MPSDLFLGSLDLLSQYILTSAILRLTLYARSLVIVLFISCMPAELKINAPLIASASGWEIWVYLMVLAKATSKG